MHRRARIGTGERLPTTGQAEAKLAMLGIAQGLTLLLQSPLELGKPTGISHPVQRRLEIVEQVRVLPAKLAQEGERFPVEGARPMPFTARQEISLERPGFQWRAWELTWADRSFELPQE